MNPRVEAGVRFEVDALYLQGKRIGAGLDDAWASEAARHALEAEPSELRADLFLEAREGVVFVSGTAAAAGDRSCDRCGEPVALTVASDVDLAYGPSERQADAQVELVAGELNIGWYDEGVIDVTDVLCEALALSLPARVTCADTDACDTRTRTLLEERGRSGDDDTHPFAALNDLVKP